MKYHLYLHKKTLLASRKTLRELGTGYELLSSYNKIQDLIHASRKMFPKLDEVTFDETIKKTYHGHSEESREMMREKKLGENNPNFNGLSDSHKKKISNSMKILRKTHHPMENRKHKPSSRLRISEGMQKYHARKKRKWVVDVSGKEHFVTEDFVLPDGWVPGRRRGTGYNK